MDDVLSFATGPLLRFSIAVAILGSVRLAALSLIDIARSRNNAKDRNLQWKEILVETVSWMLPLRKIIETRRYFSALSLVFHATLLTTIIFHQDHILLVRKTLGITWPHAGRMAIDALSAVCMVCVCLLIASRILPRRARALSRSMDYFMLVIILVTLITGFTASKAFNPLSHGVVLLIHSLCGNAILVMIPFSRFGHWILYPLLWIASATAWKLPSGTQSEETKTEIG